MKIVIDIPDENYERMKFMEEVGAINNPYLKAIANGTPLPKGHGALKDATTLKKMFEEKEGDDFTAFHFYDAIDECQTIIEADKEGAEDTFKNFMSYYPHFMSYYPHFNREIEMMAEELVRTYRADKEGAEK